MPEQADTVIIVPPEDGLQVAAVLERHLRHVLQAPRHQRLLDAAPIAKHLPATARPPQTQPLNPRRPPVLAR